MRKLLSLLLALTMLASTMSVAFAAPADVADEDQMEAVDVLMALGVVDGYPDGTYRPENVVTRAEMAKLIVTVLGYESIATSTATSFTDMGSHWAKGYVEVCVGTGIVKGYTDGTFRPDAVVTYNEAATMVVRALGFTDEALGGTWPTNYVTKAMDKDVFDNVDSLAGGATRGDIALMLFNALDQYVVTIDRDGDYTDSAEKLIQKAGGQDWGKGVIFGDEDTLIPLRAYVGTYCERYANEDDELILVRSASDVMMGDYDVSDPELDSDSDYTLKTSVDGATPSDSSVDIYVFLNGDLDGTEADMADVSSVYGDTNGDVVDATWSVDVSGVTVKDVYAVNIWTIDDDRVFDEDDADDIDDDQELGGLEFELTDEEEIDEDSYLLEGVDALADIEEDDVVYSYEGPTGYIRRVAVGQEVVSGEVTKINSDRDDFYIDGTKYELADQLGSDDESSSVTVEDDVTVKLDAFGYIYEMVIDDAETNFAVVMEFGNGSGSGLTQDDALIKLFLEDGSTETFVADGADLDDVAKGDTMSDTITWDTAVIAEGDLVEYAVNDDGEIDELYVRASVAGAVTDTDITSRGYFDGNEFHSAAVAFTYDGSDVGDADNYAVVEYDTLYNSDSVDAYYFADDNKIEAIVVQDYDAGTDEYALVDGYSYVGDSKYEVALIVDGAEVTKTADMTLAEIQARDNNGMLYLIDYDASGEVEDLIAVSTPVADTDYDSVVPATTNASISVSGNILTVDGTDYTLDSDVKIIEMELGDGNDYDEGKDKDDLEESGSLQLYLYDVVDNDGVWDVVVFEK